MTTIKQLYTFRELLEKYPLVVKNYGWTERKLGEFLAGEVLEGKYSDTERKNLVYEWSFIDLLNFMDRKFEKRKTNYGKLG